MNKFSQVSRAFMPFFLITGGVSVFVSASLNPKLLEYELTSILASSLVSGGIGLSQAEKDEPPQSDK